MTVKRLGLFGLLALAIAIRAHAQATPLIYPGWTQGLQALAAAGAESGAMTPQLANVANTLETAIATAQEAIYAFQALQQQAEAFQALTSGNWNGFVAAVNDEAQALGTIDTAWRALPSLSQMQQIKSFVASSDYATASRTVENLASNWANFDNVIQDTNMTVQDFTYRQNLERQILSAAQRPNADGSVSLSGQLQLTQESLAVIEGDLSDMETTTLAAQTYEEGVHEQAVAQEALDAKASDEFWYGQSGAALSSGIGPAELGMMIGIRW